MLAKEDLDKLKYYHINKDYKSLIKEAKLLLKKDSESFFLCDIIASTYGVLENFYVAIEYYKKALNLKPDSCKKDLEARPSCVRRMCFVWRPKLSLNPGVHLAVTDAGDVLVAHKVRAAVAHRIRNESAHEHEPT